MPKLPSKPSVKPLETKSKLRRVRVCVACKGTGISSRGRQCFPCKGKGKLYKEQ